MDTTNTPTLVKAVINTLRYLKRFVRHPRAELRRLAFRRLHARSPRHDLVCRKMGCRLIVPSNSVIAEPLYSGIGFEDLELRFLSAVAKPGMTVLDVGANIGLYSIVLGRLVGPAARVWAFEPYPPIASYCQRNLQLNALTHVTLAEEALSDKEGSVDFCVFDDGLDVYNSIGASHRPAEGISSAKHIVVPCTTLDEYVTRMGIKRVDIIKLDVEGAEEKVLSGGKSTLAENQDLLMMVEIYEPSAKQCGCSTHRMIDMLEGHGFTMHQIQKDRTLKRLMKSEISPLKCVTVIFKRSLK